MTFAKSFLNLVFTETCHNCEIKLNAGESYLCSDCEKKLQPIINFCAKCGAEITEQYCNYCKENRYDFTKARSLYRFSKEIQSLIHSLKYNEFTGVAEYFALRMSEYLHEYRPFSDIGLVCPIPLHRIKKRERSYNQAELLSRNLAKKLGIKHAPNLLQRVRYTETQTLLSKEKRCENVRDAFKINRKYDVKGKNVLIIDDVFTTGATVNSVSNSLKHSQIGKIYVLTIARA